MQTASLCIADNLIGALHPTAPGSRHRVTLRRFRAPGFTASYLSRFRVYTSHSAILATHLKVRKALQH
jgi:hypothetical protein